MGKTIYISDELYDYLNKKFLDYSMDTTIKKLLHLGTFQGKIVNKQVLRDRLAPLENYFWPILNSVDLPRKEMQREVGNFLFTTGHFDQYPDELNKLKNTQERWKSRFTSALHALRKQGLIEPIGSGAKNWQGGTYRITDTGKTFINDLKHRRKTVH